jgi:hypothetical protein
MASPFVVLIISIAYWPVAINVVVVVVVDVDVESLSWYYGN